MPHDVTDIPSANEPAKPWIRIILALGNLHRRCIGFAFSLVGPKVAYWLTGIGARMMYWLLLPLKERSEAQCAAALSGKVEGDVAVIAKQSFIHRTRNLTDLMLAAHRLTLDNFKRCGGALPEPHLSRMLTAQREQRPVILVTGYYGSFDMLPIFLGYNGIKASAVYLPHPNKGFDAYRKRIRAQSGCDLVPIQHAITKLERVLEGGGTVALVADHHASKRGIDVDFLGIPTKAHSSVGLLACRYDAEVVVAGLHRVGADFRFEVVVEDTIYPNEWKDESNAIEWVTRRYMQGIENMILRDPTQYLWGYARWGEQHARNVVKINQSQ